MKILKLICAAFASSLLLVACGGGNTLTSPPIKGGGGTVSTVTVHSNPATVAADGSTTAAITVTALDANNAGVSGATVTFASSAGGSVAVVSGTTDASGNATATLSNLTAAAGTNLTVSATAGGVTGSTTVGVVAIQQTMTLQTDVPQIPSSGATAANLSALLRDANNNALSGVTVGFSSTSGVLTVTQAVTDTNGVAKATLSSGTDPTNRTITVTATAGATVNTVNIAIVGTTLTLTGPANLVLGATGAGSAFLANSAGQGIAGASVTISSVSGNTITTSPATTDSTGHANFTVTAAAGGNDTITAVALGLTKAIPLAVSSQTFSITSPADLTPVNLGVPQAVTVTWLNPGPVVGAPVTFTATRGTVVPATAVMTDAAGKATISISSTSAGPSIVQATGTGVTAQVGLQFLATTPSQISVQASPATIGIGKSSQITAIVRDAANNLVQNQLVDFQVVTDPTNGGLSVASVLTNDQGSASTTYTSGNTSSGGNGVTISATVHSAPAITATTPLTVGGQTVFLSLGTGNTIDVSQGPAIYQVTYTVFAVDSNGAPVQNANITLSVLPVAYGKGSMGGCPASVHWVPVYSTLTTDPDAFNGATLCKNEDTDYTGNINSGGFCPSGSATPCKDYNLNGKLDPGNVAVVAPGSGLTDANGRLDVTVTYPRDHAYWVEVSLVASTSVSGTQSSTSSTFVLQGAVADYTCSIGPPGPVSAYGVAATCANKN